MRECSKLGFVVLLSFFSSQVLAAPAVLIEEDSRRRAPSRIESDVQAEPDWNRPETMSETQPYFDREPAAVESQPSINEPAQTPPVVDENEKPVPTQGRIRRSRSPLVGRTSSDGKALGFKSVGDLRERRRMGVGASFLGRSGFIGLDAELNVHRDHSVLASVGGGPGYNGVSVGYKWTPFQNRWHPTVSMAVAGWVSESTNFRSKSALPAFFRPQSGHVAGSRLQNVYLIPGMGIQSLQLRGPGVGGMIFAEVLFFTEVQTLALSPLGSVGARYFF